jgi:bacteriophage N4 adsorption protein B
MSWSEEMPWFLFGLQLLLGGAATVFVISGLDDFFVDVFHRIRALYRRWVVMPRHQRLTERHLMLPAEQPIAIMIPAWAEAPVIRRMLENLLRTVNYSNYYVFVGTYANDRATQREVEAVRERFDNLHRIVVPHDGPSSKADCLNWIYQGIRLFEQRQGVELQIFVMHDAEDLLHPLSLKLYNYLMPRKDMVQLPVLPLEPPWHRLTGGHYLDEFAENHSKDLVVRERLSGAIPSAGVGCAFSRRTFELVAASNLNLLFNTDSLTEDYDFGLRLREHGLQGIFVRQAIERVAVRRGLFSRRREVRVQELIATREYFPTRLRAAIRQKSRWVFGIALQGWRSLGWTGPGWNRYMLFRDRKALVTSLVTMLGYFVLFTVLAVWLASRSFPQLERYPPLVPRGSVLWYLVLVATFFLLVRLAQRAYFVWRLYGPLQALLSIPRQIWGNVINFAATSRALWMFGRQVLRGEIIGWEKTEHEFPGEAQLQAFRRKLGDLLLERRHLTLHQLDQALERQQETKRPLGRVLLDMGLVDEDSLLQVLGQQWQLDTREIDPYQTPLELFRILPREVAVAYSVYPLELRAGGRLVVAADGPLSLDQVGEIEGRTEGPIELCLVTTSDLAFSIRRGYDRLEHSEVTDARGLPLGKSLVQQGLLSEAELLQALRRQRRSYTRLGEVLLEEGMLTQERLDTALEQFRKLNAHERFGAFLVRQDWLSLEQLEEARRLQERKFRRLGEVVVDMGLVSRQGLEAAMEGVPA